MLLTCCPLLQIRQIFPPQQLLQAHDDFQLGAPQLWQFHDDNYNPNFEDSDDEELDMNANRRKKGKIVVNVKKSHY